MVNNHSVFTIDVENWWHILDAPGVPDVSEWDALESRLEFGMDRLLELLDQYQIKATMFWLGWTAERNAKLLERCVAAGHEIASQGYAHVLAYRVGEDAFRRDMDRAKKTLEDISQTEVKGFRAAGFSVTDETPWAFDQIREAGHSYDSSVFPTKRGHGGMKGAPLGPYIVETKHGDLVELPVSVTGLGRGVVAPPTFSLPAGGGYLRLAPLWLIKRGVRKLRAAGRPLIVYIHPREVDPDHPRLPLPLMRRFKSYVNLKTTMPKLEWLCQNRTFIRMDELVKKVNHESDE